MLYLKLCESGIICKYLSEFLSKPRYPLFYLSLYLQMYHQAFAIFQLQQDDILEILILVIREAICADSNSHIIFQLRSNCCVCFEYQLSFHTLQNICESFHLLQNIGLNPHFFHSIYGTLHNSLNECKLFSDGVAHSRFCNLLSFLIQFL